MNDYRNQPQELTDELEAFERQLRSLTPRDPDFRLPATNSNESRVVAMHAPESRARSKNKAWVATLLATWSLGAAAGIAGTMVYLSFGSISVRSDIAEVPDSNRNNQPSVVVNTNVPESSLTNVRQHEIHAGVAEANTFLPNPWIFLVKNSSRSTAAQSTLTPRNFAADLAFDSPIGSTKNSLDEKNVGRSEIPEAVLIAPSEGTQLPKPINQRDLMRDLLQI